MKNTLFILLILMHINIYAEVQKEFYANGDIKRIIEYTDGKKNGKSQFFKKNNYLFAMAEYKMGIRDGVYIEYEKDGNITFKDTFEKGKQVGQSLYYKHGKLANGKYENLKKYSSQLENFKEGRKVGLQKKCYGPVCETYDYDVLGNATYKKTVDNKIEKIAHYKNSILNGEAKQFHRNGQLYTLAFFIDGKKDGEEIIYEDNGSLRKKTIYKKGCITHDVTSFFPNGKVHVYTPYKNCKRNGVESVYHRNESLRSEVLYKEDKPKGQMRSYTDTGILKEIRMYKNAKQEGLESEFSIKDGHLIRITMYKNGLRNGTQYWFNEEGEVSSTTIYKDDSVISDSSVKALN